MALDPVSVAFRNIRQVEDTPSLPAWTPTGAPDADSVNRFRQAMGDIGDASPAERVWGMVQGWSDSVKNNVEQMTATLKTYPDDMGMTRLLGLQIEVHKITMAQSLIAKAGSSVYETTNSLLRGQ